MRALHFLFVPGHHTELTVRLCVFRTLSRFRILVAGGDGTANWVLNAIADLRASAGLTSWQPAVAVLPVGTGMPSCLHHFPCRECLAFSLQATTLRACWAGAVATRAKTLLPFLSRPHEQHQWRWTGFCDCGMAHCRWTVEFSIPGKSTTSTAMTNYFGVGVDAAVALKFHVVSALRVGSWEWRWVCVGIEMGVCGNGDGCVWEWESMRCSPSRVTCVVQELNADAHRAPRPVQQSRTQQGLHSHLF